MPTVYPTDTQINNNKNYDFVKDVSQAGWELADFLFGAKSIKKIAEGNGTWGDALTVGVNAATLFIPPAKLLKYTTPALEKIIKAASVISQHTNVMSQVGLNSAEKTSAFAQALLNHKNGITSSDIRQNFNEAVKGAWEFPKGKRAVEKSSDVKTITDKELNKIWREYRVTKALEDYRWAENNYAKNQDFIKGLVAEGKLSVPQQIGESQNLLEKARQNLDTVIHEETNYRTEWNAPSEEPVRNWETGDTLKTYDEPYRMPTTPEGTPTNHDTSPIAFTANEDFQHGTYNALSDEIDKLSAHIDSGASETPVVDQAKLNSLLAKRNKLKEVIDNSKLDPEKHAEEMQRLTDEALTSLKEDNPRVYKKLLKQYGYEAKLDTETGQYTVSIEKQQHDYNRVSDAGIRIGEGTPHEMLPERIDSNTVESVAPSVAQTPEESRMNNLREEMDSLLHDLPNAERTLIIAKNSKDRAKIRNAENALYKLHNQIKFTHRRLTNVASDVVKVADEHSPAQSLYNALTPTVFKKEGDKTVKAFNAWREHEILKSRVKSLKEKIEIAKNKNAPTGALSKQMKDVRAELKSLRTSVLNVHSKATELALSKIKSDEDIHEFLDIMGSKWKNDKAHHADYALSFTNILRRLKTQTKDPALLTRLDAAASYLKQNKNVQRSETFRQAISRVSKISGERKVEETTTRVLNEDKEELAALREEFKNATDPAIKEKLAKRGVALNQSIEERELARDKKELAILHKKFKTSIDPAEKTKLFRQRLALKKSIEARENATSLTAKPTVSKSVEPVKPEPASDVVVHSGMAAGADTAWAEAADKAGIKTIGHSFKGHRVSGPRPALETKNELTDAQLKVADEHLKKAAKSLGRPFDPNSSYVNLLRRNYYQLKDSEAVIAVSKILPGGKKVDGGTGWAVQMGIDMGKKVYVYDQEHKVWAEWTGETFKKIEGLPPKFKTFAGIGSRNLTNDGRKAIKEYITSLTVPDVPNLEKGSVARWNRLTTAEQKESVYIGRGTGERGKFGNPFPVGNGVSVKESVDKYRTWLWQKIKEDAQYARDLYELKGKRLACPGGEPNDQCHGQVILKAIEWLDSHPEAMKGK